MNFVNSTSLSASLDSCCPVWTFVCGGRIGRIAETSLDGETPAFAATEIASSLPRLSKSACAVGTVNAAKVVLPSDLTDPYWAIPVIVKRWSGPRAATATPSPTR